MNTAALRVPTCKTHHLTFILSIKEVLEFLSIDNIQVKRSLIFKSTEVIDVLIHLQDKRTHCDLSQRQAEFISIPNLCLHVKRKIPVFS